MTNRRLLADLTPLRESSAYRALWSATLVSNVGQGMTSVAVGIQVYRLSQSSFAVGLIGLFQFLAILAFGLLGGSWSDRKDRRTMSLIAASGLMFTSVLLGVLTLAGLAALPVLYLIVGLQSAFFAVGAPARQSAIPRLLPINQLPAANALSMVSWNFGATIGPMVGGFIIGFSNQLAAAYLLDAALFIVALAQLRRLPALPPTGGETRISHVQSIKEGLSYLGRNDFLKMNLYIDLVAMVFGMPRALFPAIATVWFPTDSAMVATAVGLLSASVTAGAVVSSIFSGPLTRLHRHGAVVVVSVISWGASIAAFGWSVNLWQGMFALASAGAADNVSAIFRNTIMQTSVPDDFRGRLQGFYTVVVAGGPRLGDLESGSVALWRGEAFSVVSGGLLCIVGAVLLTVKYRNYWRFDARLRERIEP